MTVASVFEWVNVHNQPIEGKAKGSESSQKGMYLGGRLESQVIAAVIPEVAGVLDLACTKNFGVIGSMQTASTNGTHVPFEGHFERLRDCNLLFTRRGGGRRRRGRSGKTSKPLFSLRGQKDTLWGPKALPVATPECFIFSS